MLKKTLNLKGVRTLSNNEQKEINGGFWGNCQAQIVICYDDSDCPCGRTCGVTVDSPTGPLNVPDVCQFY
ncbi:hypothetical protein [uncultured Dokdonia sp.]|uniref:hypothetical protein n=1 Tax=uncultured Dokdonia sp. TaxID=575653 RepID=UPI00261DED7F|nr:hypothetical protein [uncultured Dokdonia sp.]